MDCSIQYRQAKQIKLDILNVLVTLKKTSHSQLTKALATTKDADTKFELAETLSLQRINAIIKRTLLGLQIELSIKE
jgi:hypothetical protein